ncbi:MAG: methyltransferase domain-containing protein [Planctomycetes bacterium]|nr:methyltransferase domain-containing protein [Planctomycetota bacterium]
MSEPSSFESEWRARFERFAARGGSEARISGWSEHGLQRRLKAVLATIDREDLRPAAEILDLGCGTGIYSLHLREAGFRPVAADYSLGMLRRAQAVTTAVEGLNPIPLVAADLLRLPFADARFDALVNVGVLQHIARIDQALAEMARVLRPGGRAILVTLNRRSFHALAAWFVAWPRAWMKGKRRPARHAIRRSPADLARLTRVAGFEAGRYQGIYLYPRWLRWCEPLFDRLDCRLMLPLANAMMLVTRRR